MKRIISYVKEDGKLVSKAMRNCDRVANIQDAKGKFSKEIADANGPQFWRRLCAWLLTEVEK